MAFNDKDYPQNLDSITLHTGKESGVFATAAVRAPYVELAVRFDA
jgi:hypothetical protein